MTGRMMTSKNRDTIQSQIGPFSLVPKWVILIVSPRALQLYGVLGVHANNETHQAWPSHKTLAGEMQCERRQVQRAQEELVKAGALKVERREQEGQTSNLYTLIQVDTHVVPPGHTRLGALDTSDAPRTIPIELDSVFEEEKPLPSAPGSSTLLEVSTGQFKQTWLQFLNVLDSNHSFGVLSQVDNPEAYALKASRNHSHPPVVDLRLLLYFSLAMKNRLGRDHIHMPPVDQLLAISTRLKRLRSSTGDSSGLWFRALEECPESAVPLTSDLAGKHWVDPATGLFADWLRGWLQRVDPDGEIRQGGKTT